MIKIPNISNPSNSEMGQRSPNHNRFEIWSIPPGHNSLQFLFHGIATIDIILALLIGITELLFVAIPDSYIEVYNIYNMKGELIHGDFPHQSWLFMTVLIMATFWLILEFWLYQILYKGAMELDCSELNQWLNIRVMFLILNIFQTTYRIIELQFCLYDLIYVPVVMYRILEIIFVKGLTVEIRNGIVASDCVA